MKSHLKKRLDTLFPKHHSEVARLFQYFAVFQLLDIERQHFCDSVLFYQSPLEREKFWTGFSEQLRKNHRYDRDDAGDYIESLILLHRIRIRDINSPLPQPFRILRGSRSSFWATFFGLIGFSLYMGYLFFVSLRRNRMPVAK